MDNIEQAFLRFIGSGPRGKIPERVDMSSPEFTGYYSHR